MFLAVWFGFHGFSFDCVLISFVGFVIVLWCLCWCLLVVVARVVRCLGLVCLLV